MGPGGATQGLSRRPAEGPGQVREGSSRQGGNRRQNSDKGGPVDQPWRTLAGRLGGGVANDSPGLCFLSQDLRVSTSSTHLKSYGEGYRWGKAAIVKENVV